MASNQEEQLKERLKWLKEIRRIQDAEEHLYSNDYISMFRKQIVPLEYRDYTELSSESLGEHIERIERDLRDLNAGEFER